MATKTLLFKRILPPAASPIPWDNIIKALVNLFSNSKNPVQNFQNELKSFFGVEYCFLVSSGKSALSLILETLHEVHPSRNEVLIPAFTCYSVPAAIKKVGLKIKICDIDPATLDFDWKGLETIANNEENKKKLVFYG